MTNSYFILMADIINSSKMPQPETQTRFTGLVNDVNYRFSDKLLSPLTITLGDEFQGIVDSDRTGIEIIIYMEEYLLFTNYPLKLRYSLHEGIIDTPINKEVAHGMVGSGLKDARHMLNFLKKMKKNYWIYPKEEKKFKFYRDIFVVFEMFIKEFESKKNGDLVEWLLKEKDIKVANFFQKTVSQIWKKRKSYKIVEYQALKNVILSYE